jgi:hypothetical protein
MGAINLRGKDRTAEQNIINNWEKRCTMSYTRKEYEREISTINNETLKFLKSYLTTATTKGIHLRITDIATELQLEYQIWNKHSSPITNINTVIEMDPIHKVLSSTAELAAFKKKVIRNTRYAKIIMSNRFKKHTIVKIANEDIIVSLFTQTKYF